MSIQLPCIRTSLLALGALVGIAFSGCATSGGVGAPQQQSSVPVATGITLKKRLAYAQAAKNRVFFFDFGEDGSLANPHELAEAIQAAQTDHQIKKILLLSYGWNNSRDASRVAYAKEVKRYFAAMDPAKNGSDPNAAAEAPKASDLSRIDYKDFMVICISWDSDDGAVATAVKDLIPWPAAGEAIAMVPRAVCFPFTFWSKARLADRIAYHDLNTAMLLLISQGFPKADEQPTLYLVGHSFGCRILSGLCKERLGGIDLDAVEPNGAPNPWVREGSRAMADFEANEKEPNSAPVIPFPYRHLIGGVVFFQPAATRFNLPEGEAARTGNRPGYPCIVTESRHDHANGFLYPLGNSLLNIYYFTAGEAIFSRVLPAHQTALEAIGYGSLEFAGALAYTIGALPLNYAYTQAALIKDNGPRYMGDTLAQVPVVNAGLAALSGPDAKFGETSRGLLELGAPIESAGRLVSPMMGRGDWNHPIRAISHTNAITQLQTNSPGCSFVDESDLIEKGIIFDEHMSKPSVGYSLGEIDPVGANSNFDPAYRLVQELLKIPGKRGDTPPIKQCDPRFIGIPPGTPPSSS